MPLIGITGGIASGKSTFTKRFVAALGADHCDADAIARRLLEDDLEVRQLILSHVSPMAYTTAGQPNREVLRTLIYNDFRAKAALEDILHPRVRAAWQTRANAPRPQTNFLVVEIPLLFETRAQEFFPHIITVACSQKTQLIRLAARGVSLDLAHRMLDSQMPAFEKIALSHHVIWNDGSLENLQAQMQILTALLREKS